MNLIASLVNATGWTTLTKSQNNNQSERQGIKRPLNEAGSIQPLQDRSHKKAKSCDSGQKRQQPDDPEVSKDQVARKRCRGKQPDPLGSAWVDRMVKKAEAKGRGRPKGTKKPEGSKVKIDREGKSSSLTIWKKMEIIWEYERLSKLGTIKNVQNFMLKNGKMKGGFQGCLSNSKWLGARKKYKWDEFVKHCPQLSRKVHEVPNPVLEVMGVSVPRQR